MAYVQIDDVRLAYDDVGSGPEVLLIHGYPVQSFVVGRTA